jgi:hypothetical protein
MPDRAALFECMAGKTGRKGFTMAASITSTDTFSTGREDIDVVVETHREVAADREFAVDAHVKLLSQLGPVGDGGVENQREDGIGIESDSRFAKVGKAVSVRRRNRRSVSGTVTRNAE